MTGIFDNTDANDDEDSGITEFTWRSCDGCGSHLGGSRYRLAIHWETVDQPSDIEGRRDPA